MVSTFHVSSQIVANIGLLSQYVALFQSRELVEV